MSAKSFFPLLLLLYPCFLHGSMVSYDVHWLGGATTIDRDVPINKQSVDIYCYAGVPKSIMAIWQTVKFNVKIKSDDFRQYLGTTPDEVFKDYTENSYGWSSVVTPFNKRSQKSLSIELFNSTCMALDTKLRHSIELQIIRADLWRIILMAVGVGMIFLSGTLSGNPVFFYLCGIFVGVCASFMVLVYYVSKMLPRKALMYGVLIGGWTVGVYVFQQMWENISSILYSYQQHLFWYTLTMGFISFLICYRIGPPKNKRSQNLVKWTLQGAGILMIFLSSQYQEASSAIILVSLAAKYFPSSITYRIKTYLRRKFPPKPRFLSSEEYYEQGARETKHALDELRKYCSSPDCAQWKIMLKLNDSKRFASFVEGDSHLSDDEILDYESYAFSLDRSRKPTNSTQDVLEISDDDSSESDI